MRANPVNTILVCCTGNLVVFRRFVQCPYAADADRIRSSSHLESSATSAAHVGCREVVKQMIVKM